MPTRLPPRAPALLAGILGLAFIAPPVAALAARTAANPAAPPGAAPLNPSLSPLQAFVLAGAPDSFADLQAHFGQVGTVYPTYYRCAVPGGSVLGASEPALDAYAAARGLAELPRFTCQDGATVHRILTEPRLRARVLARLVELAGGPMPDGAAPDGAGAPAARAGYAGLNLDLENDGARDRRALSAFVATLAARLHAAGRKLAVDVVGVQREDPRRATYLYDDRAIAAVADTVFVIAWGIHWERSPPGPLAPLPYVRAVARRLAGLPDASRFVLGVPMYGLDWAGRGGPPNPGRALQYAALSALAGAVGAVPTRDPRSGEMTFTYRRAGVEHRVWYLDASAVAQRIAIARAYGLGAGLWRLGEEDQRVWSEPGVQQPGEPQPFAPA